MHVNLPCSIYGCVGRTCRIKCCLDLSWPSPQAPNGSNFHLALGVPLIDAGGPLVVRLPVKSGVKLSPTLQHSTFSTSRVRTKSKPNGHMLSALVSLQNGRWCKPILTNVRFHVNTPHYAPVVPVFDTHHSGETMNFVFHRVFVGSWALDFSCLREHSSWTYWIFLDLLGALLSWDLPSLDFWDSSHAASFSSRRTVLPSAFAQETSESSAWLPIRKASGTVLNYKVVLTSNSTAKSAFTKLLGAQELCGDLCTYVASACAHKRGGMEEGQSK